MGKKERLRSMAEAEKTESGKKPVVVKYGLNHVTGLIEKKKARLVVIAHDVDPIELIVWLPALCRKMDVPYVIVKGKSTLGKLVHKKTATAVALSEVNREDVGELENLVSMARKAYNDNKEHLTSWGGGERGLKSQHKMELQEKAIAREQIKKTGAKL